MEPKDVNGINKNSWPQTSRRGFLKKAGISLSILGTGGLSLATNAVASRSSSEGGQNENQSGAVRKNAMKGTPAQPTEDLGNYAEAVTRMKALDKSDPGNPRSWRNQALIHNNFCPHSNWWFLPWHRAYVHYFENICRDVLNNPAFELPYWDWTESQSLPWPFLQKDHPKYGSLWNFRTNTSVLPEFVGRSVINRVLRQDSLVQIFSNATRTDNQREGAGSGLLESTPHNHVHSRLGGDMATYMSPLDPIFWLHHCNIDRLWASWAALHGNQVPSQSLWADHKLTQFFNPATRQVVSVLTSDTKDAGRFGANYDRLEKISQDTTMLTSMHPGVFLGAAGEVQAPENLTSAIAAVTVNKAIGLGAAATFRVKPPNSLNAVVQDTVTNIHRLSAEAPLPEVFLLIGDVPVPKGSISALRVFLNGKNPSLNTPLDDPSYVGTVSFFGDPNAQGEHAHKVSFLMDVRSNLGLLQDEGLLTSGSPLNVSILPIDTQNPKHIQAGDMIKPGKIELVGLR